MVVLVDRVSPPVTLAVQVRVYDWPAVKRPVGEVMEAVIVGTAEELMKTGMSTRVFE